MRRIQAQRGALQRAFGPIDPEFAAGLDLGKIPLLGQALGQPFRPVALRQTGITLDGAVLPLIRTQLAAQAQRDRLAIGQGQTRVETLAAGAGTQIEADIGERHGRVIERLQSHLAVEHRQLSDHLRALEQLRRIERLILLHRQPFQRPGTVFGFLEADLQTVEFDMREAYFAGQHAAPHIRHHPHAVEAQRVGAVADHHVMGQQDRRETAPVAFQLTDLQGHAEGGAGLVFDVGAVFGHQWRQLAAEADVQRHQHQNQRAQAQPPAGECGQNACQTLHVSWLPWQKNCEKLRPAALNEG